MSPRETTEEVLPKPVSRRCLSLVKVGISN